jgi:hypothetical protein
VINDPRDLLCKRRRQHLDELQAKGRTINAHLLDTERVGQLVLAQPDGASAPLISGKWLSLG